MNVGGRKLPASSIKGTCSILLPEYLHLSPAIGLIGSNASQVIANIRNIPRNASNLNVAKELFYQRFDVVTSKRYGPIAACNTRSQPACHLDVEKLAVIVGLAISDRALQGKLTAKDMDFHLKTVGIACNYVNHELTGISLARYRKIIQSITQEYSKVQHYAQCNNSNNLSSIYMWSSILSFLWEKAVSKDCLLTFFFTIERMLEKEIISHEYSELRDNRSTLYSQWTEDHFSVDSINILYDILKNGDKKNNLQQLFTNATKKSNLELIELLAYSVSLQEYSQKPAIKLGRYSIGDGPTKPDCVEIVVREILESLIFDMDSQSLNPSKLPSSSHPNTVQYFTHQYSSPYQSKPTSEVVNANVGNNNNNVSGQQWFEMCANIKGCEYLSQDSLNNIPYELKPSLKNVLCTLQHLLQYSNSGNGNSWNSLKDLEAFWNHHITRPENIVNYNTITSSQQSLLSFRAPFSDSEQVHRELATLHIANKSQHNDTICNGMTQVVNIELESQRGLAAAKLKTIYNNQDRGRLWRYPSSLVHDLLTDPYNSSNLGINIFYRLMRSAVLRDSLLKNINKMDSLSESSLEEAIISCRWGEERMSIPDYSFELTRKTITNTDDESEGVIGNVTNHIQSKLDAKSKQLTLQAITAIYQRMTNHSDYDTLAPLLVFTIQHTANILTAEELLQLLLSNKQIISTLLVHQDNALIKVLQQRKDFHLIQAYLDVTLTNIIPKNLSIIEYYKVIMFKIKSLW